MKNSVKKSRVMGLLLIVVFCSALSGCLTGQSITQTYSSWFGSTWQAFNAENPDYSCSPIGNGVVRCSRSRGSASRTVFWSVDDNGVIYAHKWQQR